MGDFLLDFRPRERRKMNQAATFLRYFPDMHLECVDEQAFGLVSAYAGESRLWGSATSADGKWFVALCGRVSLEEAEWDQAQRQDGSGGWACRFLLQCYAEGGIARVARQSGHFVIILVDRNIRNCFVVTDRWGIAPAFAFEDPSQIVFSSHPDALAEAVGEKENLDLTSMAEFVLTCKLTYPHTYYRNIRCLPVASIITIKWGIGSGAEKEPPQSYFEFSYDPQPADRVEDMAEQLAEAFRASMRRRTLPILGKTAVALSGGLDSRALLCAAPDPGSILSFCCYDEENEEFQTARAVAKAAGAPFLPLKRSYDYYADHAELGIRISAGMGCIASNHFLGFRPRLLEEGVANLLTGCYCDYVFKGLALNKHTNPWTTREAMGPFSFSYYARHFDMDTKLGAAVKTRLEKAFPEELRRYDSEKRIVEVERRRMFPLHYEEDNAARTVPQRAMGWYTPMAENDLMDVYLRLSTDMKLNRSVFIRMVKRICGAEVARIRDANTGQPIHANWMQEAWSGHVRRVKNKWQKLRSSKTTASSWLNWSAYMNQSQKIKRLWAAPNRTADDIFTAILGKANYSKDMASYGERRRAILLQLFTLKLWLDRRMS